MRSLVLALLLAHTGCSGDDAPLPGGTVPHTDDTGADSDPDADGDGYPASADCDDASAEIYPGAEEVCDDHDNDCDYLIDEAGATGERPWYPDADEDGYGDVETAPVYACDAPPGTVGNDEDCDDYGPDVNPDTREVCDGLDNDCDYLTDSQDPSLDLTTAETWHRDQDGDGYGGDQEVTIACEQPSGFAASGDDCDDQEDTVHPGAAEVCDGIDNDCDGAVDAEDDDVTGCGS